MHDHRWIKRLLVALLSVATTLAGGCNKVAGGKLGSAIGQVGDSYLSRTGIPAAGAIGNVATEVGGILGEEIGKYLDPAERRQAETAAQASIGSGAVGPGSTRTWKSQTNTDVSGGSTVIAQNVGTDGRECRTQRNYVNVKGKDVEQTETLCRDPASGAWVARAS